MATKSQRYEIIIKMHNKAELKWHNVNTGTFKAHRNIKELYKNFWDYYTIYRKSDKSILEVIYNRNVLTIKSIRLFLSYRPNSKFTGIIANFKFERNGYEIIRWINFSDKILLDKTEEYFTIPEDIYFKAVEEHKKALFDYYIAKGHLIANDEISVGEFLQEKILIQRVLREGTEPSADYL